MSILAYQVPQRLEGVRVELLGKTNSLTKSQVRPLPWYQGVNGKPFGQSVSLLCFKNISQRVRQALTLNYGIHITHN